MQHDDLARKAVARSAEIAKRLHTVQRHPDRIGVVAMEVERAAMEARFDPLHACGIGGGDDAVFRRIDAQTSKTLEGLAV